MGKEFVIIVLVDSGSTGGEVSRMLWTGLIVMRNDAPKYWFSKNQEDFETSSFGDEFISLKQCCEHLKFPRYKLRMMGILVNNICFVYFNN